MTDSVKFIFKSLIKIPIVIFVCYALLNAFMFTYSYFRVLGLSYVVMQVAVENNYIPATDFNTLQKYATNLTHVNADIKEDGTRGVLDKCAIVPGKLIGLTGEESSWGDGNSPWNGEEANSDNSARVRHQYGHSVTCGVIAHLNFIWPLDTREVLVNQDEGYIGNSDRSFSGFTDDDELKARRMDKGDGTSANRNNIVIMYTVPGLKYYPDMMYGD